MLIQVSYSSDKIETSEIMEILKVREMVNIKELLIIPNDIDGEEIEGKKIKYVFTL